MKRPNLETRIALGKSSSFAMLNWLQLDHLKYYIYCYERDDGKLRWRIEPLNDGPEFPQREFHEGIEAHYFAIGYMEGLSKGKDK